MGFLSRSRPITLINASVLGPHGVMASSLRIERGRILELDNPSGAGSLVIDMGGSLILPGLINAHDHLHLNNFTRLRWRDRYANLRGWVDDLTPRFKTDPALIEPMSVALRDRLLVGGIKNLLSGVTTVCHHDPLYRPLRYSFPIRVVTRYRWSHSLLIDGNKVQHEYCRTPKNWPWIIHLAEGADEEAAAEFGRLDQMGCVGSNTVIVHGVGLRPADRADLLARGGALIWCPSSNYFLLGETAQVSELASAGRVALGTDSRASGELDLLTEIKVACETGQASAETVFRMVTTNAAAILRLPNAGQIARGFPADLTILPPILNKPFDGFAAARRSDVRMVMIEGRPLIGDPDLASVFLAGRVAVAKVRVDGREKLMDRSIVNQLRRSSIGERGLEIQ